jgi:hypothetical protein
LAEYNWQALDQTNNPTAHTKKNYYAQILHKSRPLANNEIAGLLASHFREYFSYSINIPIFFHLYISTNAQIHPLFPCHSSQEYHVLIPKNIGIELILFHMTAKEQICDDFLVVLSRTILYHANLHIIKKNSTGEGKAVLTDIG